MIHDRVIDDLRDVLQVPQRDYLITDRANTFKHEKHVTDANSPCAACHDPHGSRQNAHLINFMLRDHAHKRWSAQLAGRLHHDGPRAGQLLPEYPGRITTRSLTRSRRA